MEAIINSKDNRMVKYAAKLQKALLSDVRKIFSRLRAQGFARTL